MATACANDRRMPVFARTAGDARSAIAEGEQIQRSRRTVESTLARLDLPGATGSWGDQGSLRGHGSPGVRVFREGQRARVACPATDGQTEWLCVAVGVVSRVARVTRARRRARRSGTTAAGAGPPVAAMSFWTRRIGSASGNTDATTSLNARCEGSSRASSSVRRKERPRQIRDRIAIRRQRAQDVAPGIGHVRKSRPKPLSLQPVNPVAHS
jgi:hypothetical protein